MMLALFNSISLFRCSQ